MSSLHLTKTERRQVEAAEAVLKPWGLTYTLERTHHLVMKVVGPKGGNYRMLLACTPKDPDAAVAIARNKTRKLVHEINSRAGY
ncbi:hypothetical protein [Phenylobacterium sp.]|uniref:hypothetical protein n=1 Tax=Phenylobacterium sp. TaxID=1871053 RepID=UPI002FCB74CA